MALEIKSGNEMIAAALTGPALSLMAPTGDPIDDTLNAYRQILRRLDQDEARAAKDKSAEHVEAMIAGLRQS